MNFQGALIKEQGVTFAIIIVKQYVLQNSFECEKMRRAFQPNFPGAHIILMAQNIHGTPTYQGRKDIVNFLAHIDMTRIPWKEYTVS